MDGEVDVDVDQQLATVCPMSIYPMSFSLMSLFRMSFSLMSLSLRRARMAR
jgi:hypothetical protein